MRRIGVTSGFSACVLAIRARSRSLVAGLRDPRAGVTSLLGWGTVLETVGYRVHGVLKLVLA